MALPQPAISKNQPLRHLPMRRDELVKCSNGNMAKGKLQRQHDLAQIYQVGHAAVAANRR
jgi:hypothetical protein